MRRERERERERSFIEIKKRLKVDKHNALSEKRESNGGGGVGGERFSLFKSRG